MTARTSTPPTHTPPTHTPPTHTPCVLDGILPVVTASGGRLDGASGAWQIFRGTADQVAAVRRFVRSTFGDHASRDDAVLIASELAANAVAHSQSGQRGGAFGVHLAVLNARFAVVVVTDQGGPAAPQARDARAGADSGRGLHIVRTLAAGVVVTGGRDSRSVAALVPATRPRARQDGPMTTRTPAHRDHDVERDGPDLCPFDTPGTQRP